METTASYGRIRELTGAAMCLALALVLPFFTGQIPQIGSMLCPMHLPVLLAGSLWGPWWGMLVGGIAPLLRHVWLGMPPLITALGMSFELAAYGLVMGQLRRRLPNTLPGLYLALIGAMAAGRVVWGCVMAVLLGLTGSAFTWSAFVAGAVVNALPGIALQLILIPPLTSALSRAGIMGQS